MNYFAHGRRFLDRPYFLAGTAVPDWLNVVDRRVRARSKGAWPLVDDPHLPTAEIARGVTRHHHDDGWFHVSRAFVELCAQFTAMARDHLGQDAGMRPSFLGHILVEILLDAQLISHSPAQLDDYYGALSEVDPFDVQGAVNRIAARPTDGLAPVIEQFCQVRFLYDYVDDAKLLSRLNGVMRRVGLPLLPDTFVEVLPVARQLVARRATELLAGDDS